MAFIKVADATDVSTHSGSGLQLGEVFLRHAQISGPVPLVEGQTIHIYQEGGPYQGVWTVKRAWGSTPYWFAVIDAPNMGDYTPPNVGGLRVWLDDWTVFAKLLIYTTPSGDPQQVVLRARPSDLAGNTYINVDVVLRDYFNHRIDSFIHPMAGVAAQTAHGTTAIYYRLHIAEAWRGPNGVADPFDGSHDIHTDAVNNPTTLRTAVNAVHPYTTEVIGWDAPDLSGFALDLAGQPCQFLTMAPVVDVPIPGGATARGRRIHAAPGDWLWATLLTSHADGRELPAGLKLRVWKLPVGGGAGSVNVDLTGPMAAAAVGIGPANIADAGLNPGDHYALYLNDEANPNGAKRVSEPIEVVVDARCREGARRFAWLGKLGGVEGMTFAGREVYSSRVKRATVRKPYSSGTGYDWRERTYRSEPERTRTVSTRPLPVEYRRWLAEDMGESANVLAMENGIACPVVLLSDELQGGDTSPVGHKPITVSYRLGADNLSQQS